MFSGFIREPVDDLNDIDDPAERLAVKFKAKSVYLGTYSFEPIEEILLTSKGLRIPAPRVDNNSNIVQLDLQSSEIIKVALNLSIKSPTMILFVLNTCSQYVREELDMPIGNKSKLVCHVCL